uniref:Uncharacterized protein n=1 Tax=Rhizophora mucronata TaxID=61149 RepID=A0A2P2NVV7_RHIMU
MNALQNFIHMHETVSFCCTSFTWTLEIYFDVNAVKLLTSC